MTRRLFWLTLGAGLGISGYRRAARIVRVLGRPARAGAPARTRALRSGAGLRGIAAFARDVREGMDLYEARQEEQRPAIGPRQATEGPTLDYAR